MGYRLEISKATYFGCGGKLYGYYGDKYSELKKLPSYKWLITEGYVNRKKNKIYDYGYENAILMYGEDLKTYMSLYIKDYANYYGLSEKQAAAMFRNINKKLSKVKSSDYFVLEWC